MTSIKLLMDRTVFQALAVSLVLSSFPAFAQTEPPIPEPSAKPNGTTIVSTTNQAQNSSVNDGQKDPSSANGLYSLCPPKSGAPANVCPSFLNTYFPKHSDSLRRLIDALDGRKDKARDWAKDDRDWLIGFQWAIAALGAIATIMISLNLVGGLDLRKWAVVPTAAVSFLSALSGFYNFGESHESNISTQTFYATILEELQTELILSVEDDKIERITKERIAEYQKSLDEAVLSSARDFIERIRKRSEHQIDRNKDS